jgi:hypothetical protein
MKLLTPVHPPPSTPRQRDRWLRHHPTLALACAIVPLLFIGWVAPAFAQDRAEVDRTQILGNRELPKVLTIVPWKRPLPGEMSGKAPHSLIDELLQPVDREVFRRQVAFDAQINGPPAARTNPATAPASSPAAPTRRPAP